MWKSQRSSSPKQHTLKQVPGLLFALFALIAAAGLSVILALPQPALADTKSDLEAAEAEYAKVEEQLNSIAAEYSQLSAEQSATIDEIEKVQKRIKETQQSIDEKQAEYDTLQSELAEIAKQEYINGKLDYMDVILSSTSFEDFVSNVYYLQKITDRKTQLIDEVTEAKRQLMQEKEILKNDMSELEALRDQQQEQLDAMQAKQAETQELLNSLDDQVKELTKKHEEELAARAAEAAALAAAQGQAGNLDVAAAVEQIVGTGSAGDVVAACMTTPSPGMNWCAAWVTNVFRNAGVGTYYGNACDMYASWCYSSDLSELQPGMIVAVSSNSCGIAGALYGHVGIYIGNGLVMENIGYIATTPIDSWISYYGTVVTPRWGWLGGIALS